MVFLVFPQDKSMELLMLISILIILFSSSHAKSCIPQEAQLLLNAKHNILRQGLLSEKVDYNEFLKSWKNNTNCCESWQGVVCDKNTSHVQELLLAYFNINISSIAAHEFLLYPLSKLPNLIHLDLSHNYLNLPATLLALAKFPSISRIHMSGISYGIKSSEIDFNEWTEESLNRIKVLNLGENGIIGKIPSQLANMTNLLMLDLYTNQFNGELPEFLGRMLHLQELYLDHNKLNGTFPRFLGNMSLHRFDVSNNELMWRIPRSFRLPPSLEYFNFEFNNMTGTVSETFFEDATDLKVIHMTSSGLTINISNAAWIPPFSAEVIVLGSCMMGSTIPKWISTQESLWQLVLSGNSFQGQVPSWLWDLPLDGYDTVLNLSSNNFEGELSYFGNFQIVDLSFNNFTSLSPSKEGLFRDGVSDTLIYINDNSLEGPFPLSSICSSNPRDVDVSGNKLLGHIPYRNCSSLQLLNLDNNYFRGSLPADFGEGFSSLQWLSMENNQLVGSLPDSLRVCTQLEFLNLGSNAFEGELPSWISRLQNLRVLKLNSNRLSGNLSSEIGEMKRLHFIDLSMNQLSGTIPRNLAKLKAIQQSFSDFSVEVIYERFGVLNMHIHFSSKGVYTYYDVILNSLGCIDLSHNKLSGIIPPQLSKLKGLKQLNLSYNSFSGPIPNSIVELQQLESLDLSSNHLWGQIPQGFTTLSSLGFLNLSYNDLSGIIPRGGQMLTFESSSFQGNIKLRDPLQVMKQYHQDISPSSENHDFSEKKYKVEKLLWGLSMGLSFGTGFVGFTVLMICYKAFSRRIVKVMDYIIQIWILKY